MARLEKQLAEERRQREMAKAQDKSDAVFEERKDEALKLKTPEVKVEPTPQQRIADAEATLKEIQIKQEIESKNIGFASLKAREAAYNTRNAELESRMSQHVKDVEAFEEERKHLFDSYEKHEAEYKTLTALVKTKEKEADRMLAEAISKKSEADKIIKAQTEAEKTNQEKQEAYEQNMTEAIELFGEVCKSLKKQDDNKCFNLALTMSNHLVLIYHFQDNKVPLPVMAEIITDDCDRILELCEYLQDSKKDYSMLFDYLMKAIDWFEASLKIRWEAKETEVFLK